MIITDAQVTPATIERTGLQERSGPSTGMKILAGIIFFVAALGLLAYMSYYFYFKGDNPTIPVATDNPGAPVSTKVEAKTAPLDAPPDLTVVNDKPCPPGIVCDPVRNQTVSKQKNAKGPIQIGANEMSDEDITVRAARVQKAEEENNKILLRRLASGLAKSETNSLTDTRDVGEANQRGQVIQTNTTTPAIPSPQPNQSALFGATPLSNTTSTIVPPLMGIQASDAGEQSSNPLAQQLNATSTPRAKASLAKNPSLTINKGQSATCVLDTALSSEQIGFVSCVADFPVKSSDGKVTLLGRGTRYDGEYKKGVERGSSSSFVLWTTAKTPEGVTIDLLSPATDALGRPGVPGQLESRFWERFKGALMFSIVQDGLQLLTQRAAGKASGSNVFVLPNTTNAGVSAVNEVMKRDADIKDALITHQGTIIGITFARDLDFTTVYKLTHQPRY
jgi:type IV secretion system protein VirB10